MPDRLWIPRFAGLSRAGGTPDETTFVRSRARLRERGLGRTLLGDTLKHVEKLGLLVREGTLMDAMIIEHARGQKRDNGACDPEFIDALTRDERTMVVADKAYGSREREAWLIARGV